MIIIRLIFFFLVNLAALLVINQLVPGVELVTETSVLITTALIFTALNSYLRPLIRYFLTTFIILTLGLLGFAINAGTLYLLDFITKNISINGLQPLLLSTVIITIFNLVSSFFGWALLKKK